LVKETEGRPLVNPRLQDTSNVDQLASLLGTSYSKISYFYYVKDYTKKSYYKNFSIAKKSGGEREIRSPIPQLKHLQRKLAAMLNELYHPSRFAHGFIEDRSILTNAKPHTRKKYVFNIDIADFFTSITFPRIYGLLTSKPYSLNSDVASVIAHLCTLDGHLPQGAPTSPVISNMLCRSMDRQLRNLAVSNRTTYTRYADDITFSFYDPYDFVSADIVSLNNSAGTYFSLPGDELSKIIKRNRFSINESKTRLQHKYKRQVVTGLVVNKKPNVPREFIRKTCAIIHSIETFGVDAAQVRFEIENPGSGANILSVVYGRILYIKSIVGYESQVYSRVARRFNQLNQKIKAPLSGKVKHGISNKFKRWAGERCWVVNNDSNISQGSGFMVSGQFLITCAHVVEQADRVEVFRIDDDVTYEALICFRDTPRDIAVLKILSDLENFEEFHVSSSDIAIEDQDGITVLGFPNLKYGAKSVWTNRVSLVGHTEVEGFVTGYIDKELYAGNSGGPVLNGDGAIIGMVVKGNSHPEKLSKLYVDHSAFIAFSAVLGCIKEMQEKYSVS